MSIAESIQNIGFLVDFRESALVYPIILSLHLTCIGIFGGMIFATDMRLLGWALNDYPLATIIDKLWIWKRVGFCIMIPAGLLLGCSQLLKYWPNPYFWTKMILLVCVALHGLIFRGSVYNRAAEIDEQPQLPIQAKLAGALSLVLWLSIVSMGRLIAYWEPK